MGIKPITLPIGVTTSVEEARQSVLSGKAATLSEGSLVMPGYLTVGVKTTMSSAPMCVLGEGGALYGLDADLGAALASEMGLKVRYVPVTDGSALGQQCDIIMNGRSNNPDTITIAGSSFTVTARAEHIPSTSTVIGLALMIGVVKIFLSIAITIRF